MRFTWGAICALFICLGTGFSQGISDTAIKASAGQTGVSVRVCTAAASGTPCSPTASIFSDSGLSISKSNPFSADTYGDFTFYANAGCYMVQLSGTGLTTRTSIKCTIGGTYIDNVSAQTVGGIKNFTSAIKMTEVAAPTCAAGVGFIWDDSTSHAIKMCANGGSTQTIGAGTVTKTAGNLTASAVMVGNGSADSKVLASLGTTTTLLHGNAAGLPTFSAVNLAADVTGNLPVANLGSGTSASSSTFWRGDGTWASPASSGITELLSWCNGTVGTANATVYYLYPASSSAGNVCTGTAHADTPMTRSVTASKMYVVAGGAGAVVGSGVVKLYKNGSATAVTCTLGTGTTCNDSSNSISFVAGDTWAIGVTTGQATDTTGSLRVQFEIQ